MMSPKSAKADLGGHFAGKRCAYELRRDTLSETRGRM